jgi:hypothetical protein
MLKKLFIPLVYKQFSSSVLEKYKIEITDNCVKVLIT